MVLEGCSSGVLPHGQLLSCRSCFAPCRKDAAAFTAGFEEGVPPEQAAAAVAAVGPAAPSPAMLVAADSLQQLLRALAEQLDAVVFRWVRRGQQKGRQQPQLPLLLCALHPGLTAALWQPGRLRACVSPCVQGCVAERGACGQLWAVQ